VGKEETRMWLEWWIELLHYASGIALLVYRALRWLL
jgi:hypothetical protein